MFSFFTPRFPLKSLDYEDCWDPVVHPATKIINLSCCPFSQDRNMILLLTLLINHENSSARFLHLILIFFHPNNKIDPFFFRHDHFCLPFDHVVRNGFITANWLFIFVGVTLLDRPEGHTFFFQKNQKPIANYLCLKFQWAKYVFKINFNYFNWIGINATRKIK